MDLSLNLVEEHEGKTEKETYSHETFRVNLFLLMWLSKF